MNEAKSTPSAARSGRDSARRPNGQVSWFALLLLAVSVSALLQTSGAAQPRQNRLLAFADQILSEISHMRRLTIESEVQKGVLSRAEIRTAMQAKIEKEFRREDLENERKTMVKLGLLPADYDYVDNVLSLLENQIAGYYDPDEKKFYIADWLSDEEQKATMAHELAHALQDQHFDLNRLIKGIKDNDDRLQARRSLVEGEAVAIMFDYLLRPTRKNFLNLPNMRQVYATAFAQDDQRQKALMEAPEYLRETLLFAYVYGSEFMQVYRRWHSWEKVERLYQDPPASTEQIMHPSKYAGMRDDPTEVDPVEAYDSKDAAWRSVYSNVLGEFGYYMLLKHFINEPFAKRAAAGWDGDRVQLFEHPDGRLGLLLRSIWDSERDAQQFVDAFAELVEVKHPGAQSVDEGDSDPDLLQWDSPKTTVRVRKEGERVSIWETDLPQVKPSGE